MRKPSDCWFSTVNVAAFTPSSTGVQVRAWGSGPNSQTIEMSVKTTDGTMVTITLAPADLVGLLKAVRLARKAYRAAHGVK